MTDSYQSRLARLAVRSSAVLPPEEGIGRDTWLLLKPGRPFFRDAFASFPSGHVTSAFVMAAFLCALYPRGRWIWVLLAIGCALARIRARRHFLEDVLFSGALGWMVATWAFGWEWPRRLAGLLRLPQDD